MAADAASPGRDPNLVISIIVIMVLLITFLVMLYLIARNNFQTVSGAIAQGQTDLLCQPGQCATNLLTGLKSCPANINDSVLVDPATAVCNSPFICDNPVTPFALNSDGSTNISGICEPGVTCPCVSYQSCPDFITSVFSTVNGNPYTNLPGQRITFPQLTSYAGVDGLTDQPPIALTVPSTTFCTVPIDWLTFSTPGCNFVDSFTMTYEQLTACMGLPSACNGVTANPCLQGNLAFVTPDSANIGIADINFTPVGCVAGPTCPCGEVALYDTKLGGVICRVLT